MLTQSARLCVPLVNSAVQNAIPASSPSLPRKSKYCCFTKASFDAVDNPDGVTVVLVSDAGVEVGAVLTSGVLVGAVPGVVVGTAESNESQ